MLRIVTVDPHPALRAGLAALLRAEPGLVPVGAAQTAGEALELAVRRRPDVVLLDPQTLGADGLAACRRLKALDDAPRVLLYTAAATEPALALQARIAGADGVIDKGAAMEDLFEAIRVVGRGDSALPPLSHAELEGAAQRVEPDDLALLAMLADRTPPAEVAATLRVDRRRISRRTERLLSRLRTPLAAGPA